MPWRFQGRRPAKLQWLALVLAELTKPFPMLAVHAGVGAAAGQEIGQMSGAPVPVRLPSLFPPVDGDDRELLQAANQRF